MVIDNASSATILKPKYLIPFKISKEQAEEIFRNWANKLYSAPRSIKNKSSTKNLTGIYIPYWTFDSQTETAYRGEQIEESKSMGNKQIRSGWKKFTEIFLFFDDVLIEASRSLPKSMTDELTNWDYDEMVPFKEEFLSGFRTEIYQIDLKKALNMQKTL